MGTLFGARIVFFFRLSLFHTVQSRCNFTEKTFRKPNLVLLPTAKPIVSPSQFAIPNFILEFISLQFEIVKAPFVWEEFYHDITCTRNHLHSESCPSHDWRRNSLTVAQLVTAAKTVTGMRSANVQRYRRRRGVAMQRVRNAHEPKSWLRTFSSKRCKKFANSESPKRSRMLRQIVHRMAINRITRAGCRELDPRNFRGDPSR